ncbi:MAG TPA: AgmX/PglI C-terminal domain-containing protein [Kofleriaceae bacterium]|nr:AgmX/PglI C-terminal domain-containing protein [Kofleriaceae bacterium]
MNRWILALGALAVAAACSRSGLGEGVRRDISARMTSVQPRLSGCYKSALEERRKLRGMMWLSFDVEAESGKFTNVAITRTEVTNPGLETCVIQTVSGLALAEPQKSVVSVEYPIRFTPEAPDEPPPPVD